MVLYKPWSHRRALKLPHNTWEIAFYKWKPPLCIVRMLDREENYHTGKRIGQTSRDAKHNKDDSDTHDPTSTYSTTTPAEEGNDPTQSHTSDLTFEATPCICAYFQLTKNILPTNTPRTTSDLLSADTLSPIVSNTLASNNVDVSTWKFDVDSLVSAQPDSTSTDNTVLPASVLLDTAFSNSIPAADTLTTYKQHYTGKKVPLLSLPMQTISAVHNLNERQRIVFEIGAATLLRAHIFGLDIGTIPTNTESTETERRQIAKLNAILDGEQQTLLFQSGCAGTGKSVTIHALNHFAQSWGLENRIAVTAPTGSAALGINGRTLHNLAGINIFNRGKKPKDLPSLAQLALIVIDEISFVSSNLLNTINIQLQTRTRNKLPFGGISVIFSGDMAQLPPVCKNKKEVPLYHTFPFNMSEESQVNREWIPAFCGAKLWRSITKIVQLTYNYRAEKDPLFIDFLNYVRRGDAITQQHLDALLERRISAELLLKKPPPLGTAMVWRANKDVNSANMLNVHRNARCLGRQMFRFPATVIETEESGGSGNKLHHTSTLHHSSYLIGVINSNKAKTAPIAMLDLYIGASVTIQKNNNLLTFGIANGTEATFIGTYPPLQTLPTTITEVTLPDFTKCEVALIEQTPEFFLFHVPKANFSFSQLPPQVLPLAPHTHLNISVDSRISAYKYNVSQVQIRLFGVTTVHTAQGKTNSPNFVGNLRKDQGFNYVALSRGTSFENTFIGPHVKLKLNTFDNPISHNLRTQLSKEKHNSDVFIERYTQRTKDN